MSIEPIVKLLEEAPGIVSMMRWALRAVVWTYIGVVVVIMVVWVVKAAIGEPNWTFASTFAGIIGGTMVLGMFSKVAQKKIELKAN